MQGEIIPALKMRTLKPSMRIQTFWDGEMELNLGLNYLEALVLPLPSQRGNHISLFNSRKPLGRYRSQSLETLPQPQK